MKDNNSCPICREEFPEEPDRQDRQDNQENIGPSNIEENDANHDPLQDINDMMHIMLTRMQPPNIPPNMSSPPNMSPPNMILPMELPMTLPHIEMGNNTYIPMIIHNNNYNEDEDPDLQEAIIQSLS